MILQGLPPFSPFTRAASVFASERDLAASFCVLRRFLEKSSAIRL